MDSLSVADLSAILMAIASLVLLEGLLSADNALVLAVMVRHLPRSKQKLALRYGIWGAFLFRAIAIAFASILLKYWQLKVFGGLYLIYLAVRHFLSGEEVAEGHKPRFGQGFWGTVLSVEIADIAFSIDSILAAVALSETLPNNLDQRPFGLFGATWGIVIIYVGGILGIIMMRLVAGLFITLLDRFQGLATGAYVLVGWIGVKLVESGLVAAIRPGGVLPEPDTWRDSLPTWLQQLPEIPEWLFWTVMGVIAVLSLLYKPRRAEEPTGESVEPEPPPAEVASGRSEP